MTEKEYKGWTFKKEISFGDLLKTATVIAVFFGWAVTVENRFTRQDGLNEIMRYQIAVAETQRQDFQDTISSVRREIQAGFDRIEDKLDAKADK